MDDQRTDVLTAAYSDFTGHSVNLGKLIREKKGASSNRRFWPIMSELASAALQIARSDWRTRDVSPHRLREALARSSWPCPFTALTGPGI